MNYFKTFFENKLRPIFDVNDSRTFILALTYSQGHA